VYVGVVVSRAPHQTVPSFCGHYAFVVGNNQYPSGALCPLTLCENDARDMASLLRVAGYSVVLLLNATKRTYVLAAFKLLSSELRVRVMQWEGGRKSSTDV
jgi:hypothetical protein